MNILILDDNQSRHNCYKRMYADDVVVSCLRYSTFKCLLTARRWDIVYLDHDLGDFVDGATTYVDGWGNAQAYTGYHAAIDIVQLDVDKRPKKVIIQSVNGVGSADMLRLLTRFDIDADRQPFIDPSWIKDDDQ
jgi:hypothetical protein